MAVTSRHSFPLMAGNQAQPWTVFNDVVTSLDTKIPTTAELALFAPLASPNFSGAPTAPTQSNGTANTRLATCQFVSNAIGNLINSAPGTLDTLGEIAAAIADNEDVVDALNAAVGAKVGKIIATEGVFLKYLGVNSTGAPGADGFRIGYQSAFYGVNKNALVFDTTDGNEVDADGGVAFIATGSAGAETFLFGVLEGALILHKTNGAGFRLNTDGIQYNNGDGLWHYLPSTISAP